jgi:hypothetical protein
MKGIWGLFSLMLRLEASPKDGQGVLAFVLQLGPVVSSRLGAGCYGCAAAAISPRSSRQSSGQGQAGRHARVLVAGGAQPPLLRRRAAAGGGSAVQTRYTNVSTTAHTPSKPTASAVTVRYARMGLQ